MRPIPRPEPRAGLPRHHTRRAVLLALFACLLAAIAWRPAGAQDPGLAIVFDWPNEGETLYAGPTSLLYSAPIQGHIIPAEAGVAITLVVVKDGIAVETMETLTAADGAFSFLVTVNPSGSDGGFPAEHLTCSYDCHLPGNADLPAGLLTLRLAAPDRGAAAERHVRVDRSSLATLSVRLVRADDPARPVPGVRVSAAAWLYMWRARHSSGLSDDAGLAVLRAEALALAPTDYLLTVVPTIVDGVLYDGEGAVRLTLPPGGGAPAPVEIRVNAHEGAITGHVLSLGADLPPDLPVSAIRLPAGERVAEAVAVAGDFALAPLPLDRFLVLPDATTLARAGLYGRPETVDLRQIVTGEIELPVFSATGVALDGVVRDADTGRALPFAWVTSRDAATARVNPPDGAFHLEGLEGDTVALQGSAPGYYSRALVSDLPSQAPVELALTRRPDTTLLPWGTGAIVVPAPAEASSAALPLSLERGWIWGYDGDAAATIHAGGSEIQVLGGDFALEIVPGQRAWYYQLAGSAELHRADTPEPIPVVAGQMVNLLNPAGFEPVPCDDAVIQALAPGGGAPEPVWEPTVWARARDGLARVGVGTAQVLTLITYTVALLSLVAAPALLLWRWRRAAHPAP